MRTIYARNGQRLERRSHLPATRIHTAGHIQPPSERYGVRWAALPVEGSKAWRERQGFLGRLINR